MGLFGIPTKKERLLKEQQINNCRRIFTESINIMMSTEKIDTFMSRRNVLRDALYEAGKIAGENSKCMNGVSPKEALEIFDRDLPMILNPCIERFMRNETIRISKLSRDRIAKAKGLYLVAEEYQNEMPKECFDHWNWLIGNLVKRIENLERNDKLEKTNG